MRPTHRPRILVISSSASLRERIVALLPARYEVESIPEWNTCDPRERVSLAVIDGQESARTGGASADFPVVVVREGFDPGELLERVETCLELAQLRALAAARQEPEADSGKDARERLMYLVSSAEAMGNALGLDETLRSLCDSAVPRLAQWCSITLLEEGNFVARAARHQSPEKARLLEELGRRYSPQNDRRHPIHRVISSGRSEFVAETPASFEARLASSRRHMRLLRELGVVSFMCVPLRARGKPVGALMLGADAGWRPLMRADLILAEQLAARAGSAMERAQLYQAVEDELAERLRVEADLRRHEKEQALILDTVKAMIWFKDGSNRILRCNRAAAQWAGKTPEQIEGRRAEEIFPAGRARAYYKHDLAVMAAGRATVGALEEIRVRGGGRRWVQRDTIPYRDAEGVVVGVVVIAIDVTALKRAEDLAASKERAEREFIANVSHEFRTPVAAIKGFAQTLRAGAWKDEADRDKFFRIIESNADRLDALVGDLITLSAIEGAEPPKPAAIELRPVTLECARLVVPQARRKEVALAVSVPRGLLVQVGRPHLAQVLAHLLDNAMKFTPPGGSVRLRAQGLGKEVKIFVEDTGIGIPSADLPRVFERFFRVAKGGAPRNPGLGLHLVKKLVESYGGRIFVKSRLAHGSSFCVSLPLAPAEKRRRRLWPTPAAA